MRWHNAKIKDIYNSKAQSNASYKESMANDRYKNKHKRNNNDKAIANYIPPFDAMILAENIDTLKLSDDLTLKLKSGKVETLLDVTKRCERDFFRIPTFNKKNLFELRGSLQARKLALRPMPPREEKSETEGEAKPAQPNQQGQKPQQNKGQAGNKPADPNRQGDKNNQNNKQAPQGGNKNNKFGEQKGGQPQQNKQNNNAQNKGQLGQQNKQNNNAQGKGQNANPQQKGNKQQPLQRTKDNKVNPKDRNKNKNKRDDGITEAKTKAAREKLRPQKQPVKIPSDLYLKINKNGKWGFMDRKGRVVVEPIYDEVFNYKDDICCVELNERYGYINRQGEEIAPTIYEVASSFSEGYASVCKGGAYGYINAENEVIVDFKFEAATSVIEGNSRVKKDGKWGELFIDNPEEIRWIV